MSVKIMNAMPKMWNQSTRLSANIRQREKEKREFCTWTEIAKTTLCMSLHKCKLSSISLEMSKYIYWSSSAPIKWFLFLGLVQVDSHAILLITMLNESYALNIWLTLVYVFMLLTHTDKFLTVQVFNVPVDLSFKVVTHYRAAAQYEDITWFKAKFALKKWSRAVLWL